MELQLKYVTALQSERSSGSVGPIGIQILISVDRPLNEDDKSVIYDAENILNKGLFANCIKAQPNFEADRKQMIEELEDLFEERIFVEQIPNNYQPSDPFYALKFPWLLVTTRRGRIKLGWRKRVIEIDWSDSTVTQLAEDLFHLEEVTKIGKLVHAASLAKARQYLRTIIAAPPEL